MIVLLWTVAVVVGLFLGVLANIRLDATEGYIRMKARQADDPDPVVRALDAAPYDDEPTTAEEERLVAEAWEAVRRGDVLTDEELFLGGPAA